MHHYLRTASLPFEEVGGDLLIVDAQNDTFYSANAVGAYIWEQLRDPKSIEDLSSAVVAAFEDVEYPAAYSDVTDFLTSMTEHKLVRIVEP